MKNKAEDASKYVKDSAGNLKDSVGKIVYNAGEWIQDQTGNYFQTVKDRAYDAADNQCCPFSK